MRRGDNPAKRTGLPAHSPAEIGMVSLVYIPSLEGFYAQALDVLALHLKSLRATLPRGEIIVWDNGSCSEVVAWLQQRFKGGEVDYLMLSRYNLGKTGVLNWALAALPHRYIGFSDGDIYFYPGWWEAVRKIFASFPRAGMVSPAPALFDVLRGEGRTEELLHEEGIEVDLCVVGSKDLSLYYRGLGLQVPEGPPPRLPCGRASNGTQAYARSGHHVFVMPQEVARRVPPLPIRGALSTYSDRVLHERVEALGYEQLSTLHAFVYHLGNVPEIPPEAVEASGEHVVTDAVVQQESSFLSVKQSLKNGIRRYVQRHRWVKKKLERLYGGLFRLLYGEGQ